MTETDAAEHEGHGHHRQRSFSYMLALAALGVVFGDIGTSPLYTLGTALQLGGASTAPADVYGVVSLIVWALVLVVCVKYVGFVMRVDHDGEGGILALLALVAPGKVNGIPAKTGLLSLIVIIGTGMLFGDGIITPAISVISALEGIDVATTSAHPLIVPLAVVILIALFALQSRGTEGVGKLFGPVMLVWFGVCAVLGAAALVHHPSGLLALDPRYAIGFELHHGAFGFFVFGGVVLAVTGVEALYADMSHFGRSPIVGAWYGVVFPALLLNYLGQGALIAGAAKIPDASFYALAPAQFIYPLVALATAATVIASQALISGVFTLAEQAINLALLPRMRIVHTSQDVRGQVYVPLMNWMLAAGCITLVIVFKSSAALAAAYGLAVSTTMLCTSIAFYAVVRKVLHWHKRYAIPLAVGFLLIDGTFVAAGLPKFMDGAWVPCAIALAFVVTALTWLEGRRRLAIALGAVQMPIERYVKEVAPAPGAPNGTMIFLTPDPRGVPFVDSKHRWVRARAREERVVLLHLAPVRQPYASALTRVTIERIGPRLIIVRGRFGFMERPSIRPILQACSDLNLQIDSDETSFFYADPKISAASEKPLPRVVRKYFEFLHHNAHPLVEDLRIPPERRVELGIEVAL